MKTMHIHKVWVDEDSVHAITTDGQAAKYDFDQWPSLRAASKEQRQDFYLSYSGIHWPQIDEDLSFEGMFVQANICQPTPEENSVVYDA